MCVRVCAVCVRCVCVCVAGTPLFSFGQGLSYTTFSLACTNVTSDTGVDITCGVTNTGSRDGDDVLLVFHSVGGDISGGVDHPVPMKRLVDFGRVAVAVGDTEQLTFSVTPGALRALCARGLCGCVGVCGVGCVWGGMCVCVGGGGVHFLSAGLRARRGCAVRE